MKIFFLLLAVVSVLNAEILSIVTYPKSVNSAVLCITRFDLNNKIILVDKTFSNSLLSQRKQYYFKKGTYDVLENCTTKNYQSIITNFFNLDDIIMTSNYDKELSRTLSLFYTGSWIGEIVYRKALKLTTDTWSMDIIAYNNATRDLLIDNNLCNS